VLSFCADSPSASPRVLVAAGVIHEQVAHDARRDREEVCAVLPFEVLLVDEAQVSFVDERRRLQGVARGLPAQVAPGDAAQFVVDHRQQLVECALITLTPSHEQLSYFRCRSGHCPHP
jgi:hypothetical protein